MDAKIVIEQARPMLEDLLPQIGIAPKNQPLVLASCLENFSNWVSAQHITKEDIAFMGSLIGAFILTYLKDHESGIVRVRDNRIFLVLSVAAGIEKEFEPYAVGLSIASGSSQIDVSTFIRNVHA